MKENAAADALDRIGEVLDEFYRNGKSTAHGTVFAITNILAEYRLTK